MRIYIAGPMTGVEDLNFPAFRAAAARLRAEGHDVVNPAEINPDPGMEWHQAMRLDIAALVTCEAIHLLPGWQKSRGAALEQHIAERLGMAQSEEAHSSNRAPAHPPESVSKGCGIPLCE